MTDQTLADDIRTKKAAILHGLRAKRIDGELCISLSTSKGGVVDYRRTAKVVVGEGRDISFEISESDDAAKVMKRLHNSMVYDHGLYNSTTGGGVKSHQDISWERCTHSRLSDSIYGLGDEIPVPGDVTHTGYVDMDPDPEDDVRFEGGTLKINAEKAETHILVGYFGKSWAQEEVMTAMTEGFGSADAAQSVIGRFLSSKRSQEVRQVSL